MRNRKKKVSNEEFSIEFGDVNGIKLYEVLNKSGKNGKKIDKENSPIGEPLRAKTEA